MKPFLSHGSDQYRPPGRGAVFVFMLFLFSFWAFSAQAAVSISKAEWNSGDRELKVEGRTDARASVSVRNAANAAMLATTTADREGKWKVKVSRPNPVPCQVSATAGTSTATRTVSNRPSNCGPVVQADAQAPTIPASLGATAASSSQINLTWTASTDNVGVTAYRIERCTGAGCTNFAQIATSATASFSNTGLTANTAYRYRVRAQDAAGNLSGYSNIATATTTAVAQPDAQAPTVPLNLAASAISNTQINLAWTASTDNVGVTAYRIERCTGTACTTFAQIATSATASFSNTGLTANTAYRYRVRAQDAAGNLSGYSNIATATTPNTPVGLPSLTVSDVTVAEGGVANFIVRLSATPTSTVTVVVNTTNGTAAAPGDFNAIANRTLTFAAGTTVLTQTVAVTTIVDAATEVNENFTLSLTNAVNATIADASGLGTIGVVTAAAAHAGMATYDGPQTCLACHEAQGRQMHGSVHYQQNAVAPNVTNINPVGTANPRKAGEGPADRPLAVSPLNTVVDSLIGINTYCGTHQNSSRATCSNCHVGNGRYPRTPAEMAVLPAADQLKELANIDCLTCHQQVYKRFPAWPEVGGLGFADLVLQNVRLAADGVTLQASPGSTVTRTGLAGMPIHDALTKDFEFRPSGAPGSLRFALPANAPVAPMTITTELAAQTVHRTTRQSCLNCHGGAAGADGAKRGDLSSALANPPVALDVHMSSAAGGKNLSCASCHNVNDTTGKSTHRVRGRGLDLRANDTAARFTCESSGCHTATPHGAVTNGAALNRHTAKVACQTCHIPTFAKVVAGAGVATEMLRDWAKPVVTQSACNGRGGWLPEDVKASNVRPTYKWFDGTSRVSYVGETLTGMPTQALSAANATALGFATGTAAYTLGSPNGAINVTAAKIYPMKEHYGKLARNTTTNQLVPQSTFEFFRTGSFCRAVAVGLGQNPDVACAAGQAAPLPSPAVAVPVHTFQTINHGVEVKANSLGAANQCGSCHTSLGAAMAGGPVRMQLSGAGGLGYDLREPATATGLCNNCHGSENNNGLVGIHDRHRGEATCNNCHINR